jgi:hypothetical protein
MSKNVETLNERIAERLGKDLVDLMPEGEWQKMVDKEVLKFKATVAPKIIETLLREDFLERAKSRIQTLTQTTEWSDTSNALINTELERFIGESSGLVFAAMLSPAMSLALGDLRNRLGY